MATVQDINQISVKSSIKLENVSLTTIVFGDGDLVSNDIVSLNNRILTVRKDLWDEVNLYLDKDGLNIYEWDASLYTGNVTLSDIDVHGKPCKNLIGNGIETVLFINGKRVSKTDSYGRLNYAINQNNTLTIIAPFEEYDARNTARITLFVFSNAMYYGTLEDNSGWDPVNKLLRLSGYNEDKYIFFLQTKYPTVQNYVNLPTTNVNDGDIYRVLSDGNTYRWDAFSSSWNLTERADLTNGKIISPSLIYTNPEYISFNLDITEDMVIDYYTLGPETQHYIFDASPSIYEYGQSDRVAKILPVIYNKRVYFDGPVCNLIDNIRQGFFIKESGTGKEGSLVITDTTFDLPYVNCLTLVDFTSNTYSSSQYFVQVPEARSILNYLSEYDLDKGFLPEILKVFQRVLLDEAYDSVKRLQDTRSVTKIDSNSISKLIKLMGVTLNIYNMSIAEKRRLLEELTNFYKMVGTRPSYNIYNQATSHGQMTNLRQLFTPIKDNISTDESGKDTSTKRYVTFRNDEELGAKYYRDYVYPYVDYGDISALANPGESLLNKPRSEGEVKVPTDSITKYYPPVTDIDASGEFPGRYYIPNSDINFYAWHYINGSNRILLTTTPTPSEGDLIWVYDIVENAVVYYPPVTESDPLYIHHYDSVTDKIYIVGKIKTGLNTYTTYDGTIAFARYKEGNEYPHDMTSRETYLLNKDKYYCWKDTNNKNYYFTKSADVVKGQLAYQRTSTDLYNHHNYIVSCTVGTPGILASCTLDNGLVLYRDENDDGYYNGYLEAMPIKQNPYTQDPIPGPNTVSPGYDRGPLTFYQGQISTTADLPLVGNKIGDYYILSTDSSEYVWTSESSSGTLEDWAKFENITIDNGSIAEEIKGQWVTWYEWDRPKGWYPTNHVQVSADVPTNIDYDTFMKEFKNTFYNIASTVLYVHSIERIFTIGSSKNRKNQTSSTFNTPNTPVYNTMEYTFNNNHSIQPAF